MGGDDIVEADEHVSFRKPPALFAQWTRRRFEIDGVAYSHAELFMQAEKARRSEDEHMLSRIMNTTEPDLQKKLGRTVRGFDEAVTASNVDIYRQFPSAPATMMSGENMDGYRFCTAST